MMTFVLHFHLSPAAYRLRLKWRIPALCATYSDMSDEIFLCQNVGLRSSPQEQHGRRSVGDEGDADHPLYSETDHSPLLKILHRSSSKINNKI